MHIHAKNVQYPTSDINLFGKILCWLPHNGIIADGKNAPFRSHRYQVFNQTVTSTFFESLEPGQLILLHLVSIQTLVREHCNYIEDLTVNRTSHEAYSWPRGVRNYGITHCLAKQKQVSSKA